MRYTLIRYRQQKPQPPFVLGGEFLRLEARLFLRDALGAVELSDAQGVLAGLKSGDQVEVQVHTQQGELLAIRSAKCLVSQQKSGGRRVVAMRLSLWRLWPAFASI